MGRAKVWVGTLVTGYSIGRRVRATSSTQIKVSIVAVLKMESRMVLACTFGPRSKIVAAMDSMVIVTSANGARER